ncbi:MAG: molybdenum ABC transporter ATP-binding protein [Acidobacteria bacterium]|nr:MAG: molybdenum ABC transporter ATP-binding protein [Acidobacteriota bacterium]REK04121.1 MAG: molybdenum ABC transporter ATP-binding protein [Acidobacteriota bacterium]REK15283.1 MAG: molybdenum ABC transporter ATP-binding protein [Acidobacteriota bacterium]REK46373.1 MAG: molybdenum ABC transporter ATP-binding protein [Acidobacteriota bacterium]
MIEASFNIAKGDFVLETDVRIPSKGVTALFGPSGSGKTTFLRTVAGLERHDGCFLKFWDEEWQDDGVFVPPHKRRIGYVFQEPSLFPHLTVEKNIAYGIKRRGLRLVDQTVRKSAKSLGIDHLLDRSPSELSGGEMQRVAIARAVGANPRVLLMDEPLSSLDEGRKREILPYLDNLHRDLEIPVIYVSHSTDEVARLADRLIVLAEGRVECEGPISEVLTDLAHPLAHREDAEAIIETAVESYDEDYGLNLLKFSGGEFIVPGAPIEVGRRVRLRLAARDVSLTLEKQKDTSILNIFSAVVTEIAPSGTSQVTVRLDAGGTPVLSRVTNRSAEVLGLKPGKEVYAQAKSVAVIR